MNTLDQLLGDAVNRLDHAAARVAPPSFQPSSPHGGRLAAGVVCVAALGAGAYVVAVREPDRIAPVALPAGLREGRFGSEIVMTEVPDSDDDPETFVIQGDPAAGRVSLTKPTGNTVLVTVADDGSGHSGNVSSAADVCLDSSGAGGVCGTGVLDRPMMSIGQRSVGGQVVAYGLPDDVVAVTLSAGADTHWAQPVRGIVAYPFTASASPTATVRALDEGGNVVWEQSLTDSTYTPTELDAARTTHQTAAVMADGWFGDVPTGFGAGPEVIRRHGTTIPTGFDGPFATQGYIAVDGGSDSPSSWVWAVTVREVYLDEVMRRIEPLTGGSVRQVVDTATDAQVIIWAGDDVPDSEVDRFVGTLAERAPLADRIIDLDIPTQSAYPGQDGTVFAALMTDVVGAVDGHDLVAQADDIGGVRFHVLGVSAGSSWAQTGGRDAVLSPPPVGVPLYLGLTAIPADITSIRITLDDGTSVVPTIVDVRPLADAKLMYVAEADPARRIASFDIER